MKKKVLYLVVLSLLLLTSCKKSDTPIENVVNTEDQKIANYTLDRNYYIGLIEDMLNAYNDTEEHVNEFILKYDNNITVNLKVKLTDNILEESPQPIFEDTGDNGEDSDVEVEMTDDNGDDAFWEDLDTGNIDENTDNFLFEDIDYEDQDLDTPESENNSEDDSYLWDENLFENTDETEDNQEDNTEDSQNSESEDDSYLWDDSLFEDDENLEDDGTPLSAPEDGEGIAHIAPDPDELEWYGYKVQSIDAYPTMLICGVSHRYAGSMTVVVTLQDGLVDDFVIYR